MGVGGPVLTVFFEGLTKHGSPAVLPVRIDEFKPALLTSVPQQADIDPFSGRSLELDKQCAHFVHGRPSSALPRRTRSLRGGRMRIFGSSRVSRKPKVNSSRSS